MTNIERSYDTLGYQEVAPGQILPVPMRVFARREESTYRLYKYVWEDGLIYRLGIPSGIREIGKARSERQALSKMKKYIQDTIKSREKRL